MFRFVLRYINLKPIYPPERLTVARTLNILGPKLAKEATSGGWLLPTSTKHPHLYQPEATPIIYKRRLRDRRRNRWPRHHGSRPLIDDLVIEMHLLFDTF